MEDGKIRCHQAMYPKELRTPYDIIELPFQ